MRSDVEKLQDLNTQVREQWEKYDRAVANGLSGAPLARIDQKLGRLERERDTLEIAMKVRAR